MEYLDPHHKRTHFMAESFSPKDDGFVRTIVFSGSGLHKTVSIAERGDSIVVKVPELTAELILWKAQILERPKWLTLDFEANSALSRILIHIDRLDPKALRASLSELIGSRRLLFHYFDA